MKIFINILIIIILIFLISSVVFNYRSMRILDKISIDKKDTYYIIDTTHELYPKYNKYEKLGYTLLALCASLTSFGATLVAITLLFFGYI